MKSVEPSWSVKDGKSLDKRAKDRGGRSHGYKLTIAEPKRRKARTNEEEQWIGLSSLTLVRLSVRTPEHRVTDAGNLQKNWGETEKKGETGLQKPEKPAPGSIQSTKLACR